MKFGLVNLGRNWTFKLNEKRKNESKLIFWKQAITNPNPLKKNLSLKLP